MLRTRSFTELTIQDIVSEANSSAGSFYGRFKWKRTLLHFLHEEPAATWLRQIREFIAASQIETVTPAELAESFIPEIVRAHAENRGILRAALIESLDDPRFIARAAGLLRSIAVCVAEHTTRTAKSEDLHVANIERSLRWVIAILDQGLFLEKSRPRRLSDAEAARLRRMFVASLSPDGAA